MQRRVKKIRRNHESGAIVIEQTRDIARVASILEGAGRPTAGLDQPGVCAIIAYDGENVAGVVAVETAVDAAVMSSLLVTEASPGCAVGGTLIAAARQAAHTRGARRLYSFVPEEQGGFLANAGFVEVPAPRALDALAGTSVAQYLQSYPQELAQNRAWLLDLSMDGIIIR